MKCQICNEVEAVININGNVNGVESSLYLCHDCAEENDIGPEVLRSLDKTNFLEKEMCLFLCHFYNFQVPLQYLQKGLGNVLQILV